jgi:hypothetical protein
VFKTKRINNEIHLLSESLVYSPRKRHRAYVYAKAGARIGKTRFKNEKKLTGSETEIIEQIHKNRFNTHEPYVITGGHFYQLFVRNLGVFYNALLDPRIPTTDKDWMDREIIALKTVALDLEIFSQAGKDFTTIIPVRKNILTCFNFYTRPSDSLFAILYTLLALTDENFICTLFPIRNALVKKLHTIAAGKELLEKYSSSLKSLINNYVTEIIDPETDLIKKDLLLASARDGIKRESSFYDNVIAWATVRVAKKLNLYEISEKQLFVWREKIMQAFWDEKNGIFLDDLSEESQKKKLFSADSFIIISTGFFDLKNTTDMKRLKIITAYVQKNKLDDPFPIHYSTIDQMKKLYRPVRHFAPTYMGTSIWSHWGIEYIKALIYTKQGGLAKKHLERYRENIEKYGGYPEVYDSKGNPLKSRLYHTVLHNGWVINYEQTKLILQHVLR